MRMMIFGQAYGRPCWHSQNSVNNNKREVTKIYDILFVNKTKSIFSDSIFPIGIRNMLAKYCFFVS